MSAVINFPKQYKDLSHNSLVNYNRILLINILRLKGVEVNKINFNCLHNFFKSRNLRKYYTLPFELVPNKDYTENEYLIIPHLKEVDLYELHRYNTYIIDYINTFLTNKKIKYPDYDTKKIIDAVIKNRTSKHRNSDKQKRIKAEKKKQSMQ